MDDLEEIYENFIDQIINDYPLTTNRLSEFDDAININQQIINRISNIRRYLQTNDQEYQEYQEPNNIEEIINQGNNVVRRQGTFTNILESIIPPIVQNINNYIQGDYIEGDYIEGDYIEGDYIERDYIEEHIDITSPLDDDHIVNTIFEYLLNNTLSNSTFTELNELSDVKVVLTKEEFDKFEKKCVSKIENITNCSICCSICMDNYNEDEKVVILKCKHYYHENCIENWLCNQKVTCPICRKDTREML